MKPHPKDICKLQVLDADSLAIQENDWLTTNQVGRLLQISPSSLEKARSTEIGPFARLHYHKIGRSVRYSRQDVLAFLDELRVAGTCRPLRRAGE